MAAARRYGDDIRQTIHELVNEHGRPATEVAAELEKRDLAIPSLQRIRDIARDEARARRPDLSTESKDKQLQSLIAGIVKAVDRALQAAEQDPASIDGDELLKLARTVREIEPLLKPEPQKNAQDTAPTGLLSSLSNTEHAPQRKHRADTTDPVRSGATRVDAVNTGLEAA